MGKQSGERTAEQRSNGKPKKKAKKPSPRKKAPDGRGKRPADPNKLARWIVERATKDGEQGLP